MAWIFGEGDSASRRLEELQQQVEALQGQLEQRSRRLRDWVAAFPEPVWILDASLKSRFWNEALIELSRKERVPENELFELSVHAWFREPDVHDCLSRTLVEGRPQRITFESNGRHHEMSCSLVEGGVIAVFHEVTQLKRAEQARVDLVVNVSHELRTPLTAIKGFSDTLRQDFREGRLQDCESHLEVITRNVDRLLELIQDLLLVSKLESGGGELELQQVSTRVVTERALQSLQHLRNTSGTEVRTVFEASVVYADPVRIEQVLVNLVGNALRYVPAPHGEVSVIWKNELGGTVLRVEDNGPGIPEELQPRIFERFFRGDLGRSRDLGGSGLGLSIVKHIMLRHGGSVELESRPGEGAKFVCKFKEFSLH